jgi:hypothetical protein
MDAIVGGADRTLIGRRDWRRATVSCARMIIEDGCEISASLSARVILSLGYRRFRRATL